MSYLTFSSIRPKILFEIGDIIYLAIQKLFWYFPEEIWVFECTQHLSIWVYSNTQILKFPNCEQGGVMVESRESEFLLEITRRLFEYLRIWVYSNTQILSTLKYSNLPTLSNEAWWWQPGIQNFFWKLPGDYLGIYLSI